MDGADCLVQEMFVTPTDFGIDPATITNFCRRWKIKEWAVFGSAVHGGLKPGSDIDLLVTFTPEARWSMFDHYRMENELVELLARDVDLVNIRALEENPNPIYRKQILDSARVIYAA